MQNLLLGDDGSSDLPSLVAEEPLAFQPLISDERSRSLTSSNSMALATTQGR